MVSEVTSIQLQQDDIHSCCGMKMVCVLKPIKTGFLAQRRLSTRQSMHTTLWCLLIRHAGGFRRKRRRDCNCIERVKMCISDYTLATGMCSVRPT